MLSYASVTASGLLPLQLLQLLFLLMTLTSQVTLLRCYMGPLPFLHPASPPFVSHQRTLISSAHMRLSSGSDALNFSISGSTLPVKRPPHNLGVASSAAGAADAAVLAGAAAACVINWWDRQGGNGQIVAMGAE